MKKGAYLLPRYALAASLGILLSFILPETMLIIVTTIIFSASLAVIVLYYR